MPDQLGGEQTVKGDFAEEMLNPSYGFQVEELSSASVAISSDKEAESSPVQLVQIKSDD